MSSLDFQFAKGVAPTELYALARRPVSTNWPDAFLQSTRVPASMKDGQYPNFFVPEDVVNPVEFEPVYRRPANVGKSDSMMQGRLA